MRLIGEHAFDPGDVEWHVAVESEGIGLWLDLLGAELETELPEGDVARDRERLGQGDARFAAGAVLAAEVLELVAREREVEGGRVRPFAVRAVAVLERCGGGDELERRTRRIQLV